MKTDQLIDSLADDLAPVQPAQAGRRLPIFIGLGLGLSLVAFLFFLGIQPDLGQELRTPAPYLKEIFSLGLGLAGFWLVRDAATPGRRTRVPLMAAAAMLSLGITVSALQLVNTDHSAIKPLLLGISWTTCSSSIFMLSLPLLATVMIAVRGLAPTHLRLAGFGAGLCAGALAAALYAFHCVEQSTAFITLWYSLGISLTAALGALVGPWALRW